jgi:hypothetical protein
MDIHEENYQIYIRESKKNIDRFIDCSEYKKAFALLIMVLERLDDTEKTKFIDYYSKNLNKILTNGSYFYGRY